MPTVYREVWTGEVVKGFQAGLKDTFLDGVRDYSQYVTGDDEAQVIHASYFGVEPDVLINNTTYPIDVQELHGKDIPISLDKYQTKATPVTDDELYALAFKKMEAVKQAHSDVLVKSRLKMAIHAFAPNTNTVEHPVLKTTGETVGNRKRMRWADIIALRSAYAKAGIEIEGIRLVLCPDHVNDLLIEETSMLAKSYANFQGGVITNQLGLEFREYFANPYFNVATGAKVSFGAIVNDATDMQASVAFPLAKVGKATGKTKMYFSESKTDPLTQRNLINFRNYFIALPLIEKGFAAIVSDIV
ncbi:hypothetical protein [Dysgonomonas sp. ZJ279]|uniref:hypothetical protein n=1 Tax=Dysgonomonas sp. ZJ279 TaxID=2709796 RepID=UPI0013EE2737|nr:hypothetical protein [Dysgonomonas sp. ZJ279]